MPWGPITKSLQLSFPSSYYHRRLVHSFDQVGRAPNLTTLSTFPTVFDGIVLRGFSTNLHMHYRLYLYVSYCTTRLSGCFESIDTTIGFYFPTFHQSPDKLLKLSLVCIRDSAVPPSHYRAAGTVLFVQHTDRYETYQSLHPIRLDGTSKTRGGNTADHWGTLQSWPSCVRGTGGPKGALISSLVECNMGCTLQRTIIPFFLKKKGTQPSLPRKPPPIYGQLYIVLRDIREQGFLYSFESPSAQPSL